MICEAWLSAVQFDQIVVEAQADPSGAGWRRVDAAMPCVWEPLTPPDAALLDRALAIRALKEQKEDVAVGWFRAARRIAPDWTPPESAAHAWELSAAGEPGAEVGLRPPEDCELRVDGGVGHVAHEGQGAIVQCLGDDGHMRLTTALDAAAVTRVHQGEAMPGPPEPEPPRGISARTHADRTLLYTGGAFLGASAVMFGLSALWNTEYYDIQERRSADELDDLRGRTNGACAGGIVMGVAGAGLVGAGVFTVRW